MEALPQWLRGRSGPSLRRDVIAGLSLAAFAIPESLAYASLANLPPINLACVSALAVFVGATYLSSSTWTSILPALTAALSAAWSRSAWSA
jgi:SulP family sulfate permease